MRVGLLAYLLNEEASYRSAGVSTYIGELLSHLGEDATDFEYSAFHDCSVSVPRGVRSVPSPFPLRHPLIRILWEQTGLPIQAYSRVELMHGLVNVVPLASNAPSVVTVHDLSFWKHPERFRRSRVAYLSAAVALSARRANHVIAVSASTKSDLLDWLKLDPDRVTVVHPGVGEAFRRFPSDRVCAFSESVCDGRPYILYVGTLEPRKNIDVLLRAFADLRTHARVPHALAIVGGKGWMYDSLFSLARALGIERDVFFEGFVPLGDLPLWYNGADIFAYPSVYEGFGLPVIEAMACGTPVVTSATSSLVELGAGACLIVEPGSVESLSMAIGRILADRELAGELGVAGRRRASTFSWDRTAAETVAVYERVLGGGR